LALERIEPETLRRSTLPGFNPISLGQPKWVKCETYYPEHDLNLIRTDDFTVFEPDRQRSWEADSLGMACYHYYLLEIS